MTRSDLSTDRELDRLLAEWLAADGETAPDVPVEAAVAFAYDHPRSRWMGWLRRDAMAPGLRPLLRPALLVLALIGLIGLTVGGAVLLDPGPDASPTPRPTLRPGEGFLHDAIPGERIDPDLYGAWLPEDDYLGVLDVTFYPASSDMCVNRIHTTQDCLVLTDPRNTFDRARGQFGGGIVVVRDGKLIYDETIGSPMRAGPPNHICFELDVEEEITYRIEGDRLHLAPAGACWPAHDTGWWSRAEP